MIASGAGGGKVQTWDARTGKRLMMFEGHKPWTKIIAFSSDGSTFAAAGGNTIVLWDARTGEHLTTLTVPVASVDGVALSPNGLTIASYGPYWDHTVRLWDVSTGEHLQTLEGHTGGIRFLTFSPDGRELSSASSDGTMLFWDLRHITTWGEIKRSEPVGGTRRSVELGGRWNFHLQPHL